MLSMHNVTNAAQAASYFSKDDYYVDHEQREPSAWWGRGAADLGLAGTVDRDTFFSLLRGELPDGSRLPGAESVEAPREKGQGRQQNNNRPSDGRTAAEGATGERSQATTVASSSERVRRAALDLTFSAPKSVSLLALVGGHEGVSAAHDAAVETALAYLEKTCARARFTEAQETWFQVTENLVVARFSHDTSRSQDPQLHTHCVTLNMTKRTDGQWRALSNEEIYRSKMAAGAVYRAELAKQLRVQGYALRRTHSDGRFEVEGFTAPQLEHFSQRRAEVEAKLEGAIVPDAKAAERATLLTRQSKRDVDREQLQGAWTARADELAINFDRFRPSVSAEIPRFRQEVADRALQFAVAHLTERQVAFEERDLLRHALPMALGELGYSDLQRTISRDAGLGRLIRLPGDAGSPQRFTTHEALGIEQNFAERMRAAQGRCVPIFDTTQRTLDDDAMKRFTEGQRQAAHLILSTTDRVVGVQGYAGTGKSTLLQHVYQVAEQEGFTVRGFAPSAAAAKVLQEQAGLESQTLASHLLRPVAAKGKGRGELWIVDEMSMVGNRDALRLLRAADKAGARLVLLGDKDQLPSVEAGRAFELLMAQGMRAVHMREVVRQKDPTLKQAVKETIARQPQESLTLLAPRVLAVADDELRYDAVAKEYFDRTAGKRSATLIVTPARSDARAITERVRAGLKERGELLEDRVQAKVLVSADFTTAQTKQAVCYEEGAVVRFGRAYSRLGVQAGEYWQVSSVEPTRGVVHLAHADGRSVEWLPHRMAKAETYRLEDRSLAEGDLIRWTRNDKANELRNGDVGRVTRLEGNGRATVYFAGEPRTLDLRQCRHWDHGYVGTAYGAQGRTTDDAIIHLDTRRGRSLGFESWYVALSRARSGITVFANTLEGLPKVVHRSMAKESSLDARDPHRSIGVRIDGALAFRLTRS